MTMVLIILIVFMIAGGLIAIQTERLLASVISVGAVGFLLAIAFLLLGAPDIAITQVVVEVLSLIILIRATLHRDLRTVSGTRESFGGIVTLVVLLVILLGGLRMLHDFPEFGSPAMERFPDAPSQVYLRTGASRTGAPNIVTAILLDFRAYDTLGEATVLFCAILGACVLLRKRARTGPVPPDNQDKPT